MILTNYNQQSLFVKAILSFISIYLFTGTRVNEVNAASFTSPGNARESLNSCKSFCNDSVCHYEAKRLKDMMNEKIDPCDDFFNFTCGGFVNSHKLPNENSEYSLFTFYQSEIDDDLHTALLQVDSNDPKSIVMMKNFYESCIKQDEDTSAILNILKNIGFPALLGDTWNETAYDWKEALYRLIDEGIQIEFPVIIKTYDQRLFNNLINYPQVGKPETFIAKDFSDDQILQFQNFVIDNLLALGASEDVAKRDAEKLVHLEIDLNNITTQPKIFPTRPLKYWSRNYTIIPWLQLFDKISKRYDVHVNSSAVILAPDEKYIVNLQELIEQTPKRTIANYIAWKVLMRVYRVLPKQFSDIEEKHYNATFARRGICMIAVKNSFSIALDALYVRKFAPSNPKEDQTIIVENIRKQIEIFMKQANWMDDDTRKAVLKKINHTRAFVGYNKELLDDRKIDEYYSKVQLTTKSLVKTFLAMSDFKFRNELQSWYDYSGNITWTTGESVVTINPVYKVYYNALALTAASLISFWYTHGRPNYLNYGALGSLIGHEMYHAVDNTSRFLDENGQNDNWWSNDTDQKYNERSQCLIEQFNNFTYPNLNLKINGKKTLNENIADHNGFKAAYYAYVRSMEENGISEQCLPNMNYTPKQWFWISSAMNWCKNEGADSIRNAIKNDPHPPHYARVLLPYSNFKEFADDFKCKPGSRMNPEKKCHMW